MNFAQEETKILEYWQEINAFEKQLELTKHREPYSFYDGPPFATGLPHYGHLLSSAIKDTVCRYWIMNNKYVERRFGWDCHGLPVEHEIDKLLNIKGRQDVLDLGIDKYNDHCREVVMRYSKEWEATITRVGRWIDFKNDYKTLNLPFMETVWWAFKELWKKDLVYRGCRVMPYSTGCTTPLSNFEAGLDYKDVVDPAVVISFPLVDEDAAFLAWTTTPWTLPSNYALCVHPDFEYVKIKDDAIYPMPMILLKARLDAIYKDPKKAKYTILETYTGKQLEFKKYKPLFNYFPNPNAYKVLCDEYVTADSGTGIVHQAPGFGEDDNRISLKYGLITTDIESVPCPVDESGNFTAEIVDFKGMYVKEADKLICRKLKSENRLIKQGTITHSYPFCWRSETPLLYKAVPSWFIKVEHIREDLIRNNKKSKWVPEFVQEKRFQNWLANARDWNISRNRFWGTPIPIWVSDDFEEMVCIGSVEELEALTGEKGVTDIHRHFLDHLTIKSKSGKILRRTDEVFDCWFESGAMPYAQQHYPFENSDKMKSTFPADFIAEGLDQTRGWFYTLLVLSTHLFDQPPAKNQIVYGLVLAEDGKKMSKRLKNYPDPLKIINCYGADAMRLYLINSPVVRADSLRFKEEGVKELLSKVFLPWFNSFKFFKLQTELLKTEFDVDFKRDSELLNSCSNVMDKWILASEQSLIAYVVEEMANYRLYTVVPRLLSFIDELTNWYIRFNRKRLKGENGLEDALYALNTLYEVLMTISRLMAPFTPFMAEYVYLQLLPFTSTDAILKELCEGKSKEEALSVHFLLYPAPNPKWSDDNIVVGINRMQRVIELVRLIREQQAISLKMPLRELIVIHGDAEYLEDVLKSSHYIKEELNILEIKTTNDEAQYDVKYKLQADFKALGQKLKKDMPIVKKGLGLVTNEEIKIFLKTGEITVNGHVLNNSEVVVQKYFEPIDALQYHKSNMDGNVIVLLDCKIDAELAVKGYARELINRVQRLRKKGKMVPTDVVEYYIVNKDGTELEKALVVEKEMIEIALKAIPKVVKSVEKSDIHEEQEIMGETFELYLKKQ